VDAATGADDVEGVVTMMAGEAVFAAALGARATNPVRADKALKFREPSNFCAPPTTTNITLTG
jgi:hypothetical protein